MNKPLIGVNDASTLDAALKEALHRTTDFLAKETQKVAQESPDNSGMATAMALMLGMAGASIFKKELRKLLLGELNDALTKKQ